MNELILKDVRCFRGEHIASLAPITVLVGENSTGKSTFLALTRIAWDLAFGVTEPDFNEEPFQMGSYEELAHGGRGKRATSFSVGFSDFLEVPRRLARPEIASVPTSVLGVFSASAGQPTLSEVKVENGPWRLEAQPKDDRIKVVISTPSGRYELEGGPSYYAFPSMTPGNLFSAVGDHLEREFYKFGRHSEEVLPQEDELGVILAMLSALWASRLGRAKRSLDYSRPLAVAPIRSRPKRTYDPLREIRSPEGEHVPMLLARLDASDQSAWEKLAADLSAYGRSSGLFEEVVVRRFAGSESSPFQLRVKLAGQQKEVNLVDVGYGVSQVLPILVDALIEPRAGFFLMQQPEVHLHPKAQAELGTFIATLARDRRHRFFVETHSDYLVDRLRMEVKNKVIRPEMVAILFFERLGSQVKIHKIGIDGAGNIVGQPDSYRRFFLEEELRAIL